MYSQPASECQSVTSYDYLPIVSKVKSSSTIFLNSRSATCSSPLPCRNCTMQTVGASSCSWFAVALPTPALCGSHNPKGKFPPRDFVLCPYSRCISYCFFLSKCFCRSFSKLRFARFIKILQIMLWNGFIIAK